VNKKLVPANEYKAVTSIVARYIEALRVGNVDMLSESFNKNSVTYGTVDGKLMGGARNATADFINEHGKSPEIEAHVDVLDMTPTSAVVRVVAEKDAVDSDSIEYLTLIKIDGSWTIFAKVFHQFDR
jgi:hypothetical protein